MLNNVRSYVTSHLHSGLVMTCFGRRRPKDEPRKCYVFFVFMFVLLHFQFEFEIMYHV